MCLLMIMSVCLLQLVTKAGVLPLFNGMVRHNYIIKVSAVFFFHFMLHIGMPEQALGWLPLGVVEDKLSKVSHVSCSCIQNACTYM